MLGGGWELRVAIQLNRNSQFPVLSVVANAAAFLLPLVTKSVATEWWQIWEYLLIDPVAMICCTNKSCMSIII